MKMDGDKILYECILGHHWFQLGPHIYEGRRIKVWDVEICDRCAAANWDGIMLDRHPDLAEHLKTKSIPITLNSKGWLNIPKP